MTSWLPQIPMNPLQRIQHHPMTICAAAISKLSSAREPADPQRRPVMGLIAQQRPRATTRSSAHSAGGLAARCRRAGAQARRRLGVVARGGLAELVSFDAG